LASRRPLEVLTCETVPRIQLVKPRGEHLVGSSHNRVRLLLVPGPVLPVLGLDELSLGPPAGIRPLHFRELAFELGEGTWRHALAPVAIFVAKPLDAMGIWFIDCQLCPLGGLLVALNFAVARAPPDLNRDLWSL